MAGRTTTATTAAAAVAAPWTALLHKALKKNGSVPAHRYCQLATIGLDGGPRVRTIVYRGLFDDEALALASTPSSSSTAPASGARDGHARESAAPDLVFITDARSSKAAEIAADARAEVAWYQPLTREQFRFRGRLVFADGSATSPDKPQPSQPSQVQALRARVWAGLSDTMRAQMHWPAPGAPRDPAVPDSRWREPPQGLDVSSQSPPPDTFAVVLLQVEHVDHLCLKSNSRRLYDRRTTQNGDGGDGGGDGDDGEEKTVVGDWVVTEVNP